MTTLLRTYVETLKEYDDTSTLILNWFQTTNDWFLSPYSYVLSVFTWIIFLTVHFTIQLIGIGIAPGTIFVPGIIITLIISSLLTITASSNKKLIGATKDTLYSFLALIPAIIVLGVINPFRLLGTVQDPFIGFYIIAVLGGFSFGIIISIFLVLIHVVFVRHVVFTMKFSYQLPKEFAEEYK